MNGAWNVVFHSGGLNPQPNGCESFVLTTRTRLLARILNLVKLVLITLNYCSFSLCFISHRKCFQFLSLCYFQVIKNLSHRQPKCWYQNRRVEMSIDATKRRITFWTSTRTCDARYSRLCFLSSHWRQWRPTVAFSFARSFHKTAFGGKSHLRRWEENSNIF
jgi:hypothetical protein